MLRKFFFNFFGIILRPIFKFNNNEIGSNLIILGRGVSSNYYFFNYEKFLKIKDVLMVNFETNDFKKIIKKYLKVKIYIFLIM